MDETERALSEALNQTGFLFENFAFETALQHGWSTRSNRLYIDAEEQKTREMDLLCYRITKGMEISTCTALLISCKARTGKPWVLLTRQWPDRRLSWYPYPPVPVWTNSDALRFEVERPAWGLDYFNLAEATGLRAWASDSPREVFALHEFDRIGENQRSKAPPEEKARDSKPPRYKAIGDSSLYEGTMSLLKALAYETKAVEDRQGSSKDKKVYQFNLIQLLDGDLYEAALGGVEPTVRRVDRYRYFARTMLDGKDFSARIDFCTRPAFPALLEELSKVHEFNWQHFNAKVRNFYETVLTAPEQRNALIPLLERRLEGRVASIGGLEKSPERGWARLEFLPPGGPLKLLVNLDVELVARLKANRFFMALLERAVADIYRYPGPVEVHVDDDIPF
jgi:hypothetical protein